MLLRGQDQDCDNTQSCCVYQRGGHLDTVSVGGVAVSSRKRREMEIVSLDSFLKNLPEGEERNRAKTGAESEGRVFEMMGEVRTHWS